MLVISNRQMGALKSAQMSRFENEMMAHAHEFAPRQCAAWGEERTRDAVRHALRLADAHGFDLRGPMRLVVELVFTYGSALENDPRFAPVGALLNGEADQMHRAESIYAWMVDDRNRAAAPRMSGPKEPTPPGAQGGTRPAAPTVAPCAAGSKGPYASADAAARAALAVANPKSIADNTEYSGLVYKGSDGKYYTTGPAKGTDQGADPLRQAPAPAGTTVVGDYHTHGDYSTADPVTGAAVRTADPSKDQFNSDNFSSQDKSDNRKVGYPGYLGTPSGTFRKYDPATGADTTL